MSPKMHFQLNELFKKELKDCQDLSIEWIEAAKKEGKEFTVNMDSVYQFEKYNQILSFFEDNELIVDIQKRKNEFKAFKVSVMEMIENAKAFNTLS